MTALVPFVPHVDLHNIEAEQQLLGAIMINNQAYGMVASLVGPEHFFEPLHREIYRLAGELIVEGKVASPVTIRPLLPLDMKIADMSIGRYLVELAANATTIINAPDFARDVFDFWQMRQIAEIGSSQSVQGTTPAQQLTLTWQSLDALRARMLANDAQSGSIGAFAVRMLEELERPEAAERVPSTGLADLDKFIGGGWRPNRLVVMGGRPGMGKTVVGIGTTLKVARQGVGCCYFSLEIDGPEFGARAAAALMAHTHFPADYSAIVSRQLTSLQFDKMREKVAELERLPIHVDFGGGLSMFEIASRVQMAGDRFAKRGIHLGLVVVDYLGLVRPSDRYAGRKVDELGEIAWAGKELAKKYGCACVMFSQLNRSVEGREDKRPHLQDLRESGNIEEHADIVGMLYRPAYYDDKNPDLAADPDALAAAGARKHTLEIGLEKNRLGPTRSVEVHIDVARCAISNMAR